MATVNTGTPRSPMLDMADFATKLAPLLFGSGKTTQSQSQQGTMDPHTAAQMDELIAAMTGRANSSAQSDKVVEDILYRAQLAFAPVLGEEKTAGVYNSSTRNLLAKEAVGRATAASAQAVLQDQQAAMQMATQLAGAKAGATSGKSTATSGKTGAGVPGQTLLAGIGGSMALSAGMKKAGQLKDKYFPGQQGYKTGDIEDISGNLYDPSSIEQYFVDGGAMQSVGAGAPTGGGGVGGAGSSQSSMVEAPPGDLTSAPTILADAGGLPITDAATTPAASGTPVDAATGISALDAQTIGPIGVQKANEFAGDSMLESPAGPFPDTQDPFGFDPSTLDTGGDAATSSGLNVASTATEGADAASTAADITDLGVPYLAIANVVSGGQSGDMAGELLGGAANTIDSALSDIPIVGDVYDRAVAPFDQLAESAGSVICTESIRQGLIDANLVAAEIRVLHRRRISKSTVRGYHYIAYSHVLRMRCDRNYARKMAFLAAAYCRYVTGERRTMLGWLLRYAGEAIAWTVGKFVVPSAFRVEEKLNAAA